MRVLMRGSTSAPPRRRTAVYVRVEYTSRHSATMSVNTSFRHSRRKVANTMSCARRPGPSPRRAGARYTTWATGGSSPGRGEIRTLRADSSEGHWSVCSQAACVSETYPGEREEVNWARGGNNGMVGVAFSEGSGPTTSQVLGKPRRLQFSYEVRTMSVQVQAASG